MFLAAAAVAAECYGVFLNPPASANANDNKQNGGDDLAVETFDDAI